MELADLDRLHSTSGGVRDTELNEFAVSPTNWPVAVRAVTIVTPVANMLSAARNSVLEKLGVAGALAGGIAVLDIALI
jgi:hypothetical protein